MNETQTVKQRPKLKAVPSVPVKKNRATKRAEAKAKPVSKKYKKTFGKIINAQVGFLNAGEPVIGLRIDFAVDGNGLFSERYGGPIAEHQEGFAWTKEEQVNKHADFINYIAELLKSAGVGAVNDLIGKPVQLEVEDSYQSIKDWRIFTEVL
jgi:hypothetical protein